MKTQTKETHTRATVITLDKNELREAISRHVNQIARIPSEWFKLDTTSFSTPKVGLDIPNDEFYAAIENYLKHELIATGKPSVASQLSIPRSSGSNFLLLNGNFQITVIEDLINPAPTFST